jgi:hypothetical protein
MNLQGASVNLASDLLLPSGVLSVTATTGDVNVSGRLGVDGQARQFFDVTRYTDGGSIDLSARQGSVRLLAGSDVSVAAHADGGDAGYFTVRSPGGVFDIAGALHGSADTGRTSGSFTLDAGSVADFDALRTDLDNAGFFQERNLRVRSGDVTVAGVTRVRDYSLSADAGDITVTGTIDASGETGGRIHLAASGSVVVDSLPVFNAASSEEVLLETTVKASGITPLSGDHFLRVTSGSASGAWERVISSSPGVVTIENAIAGFTEDDSFEIIHLAASGSVVVDSLPVFNAASSEEVLLETTVKASGITPLSGDHFLRVTSGSASGAWERVISSSPGVVTIENAIAGFTEDDSFEIKPVSLIVAAENFSNAGKGGQITLEAGSAINGVANANAELNLSAGSLIDLSVKEFLPGSYTQAQSKLLIGDSDTLGSLAKAYLPTSDEAVYRAAFKQRVAELNALDLLAEDPLALFRPRDGVPDEQRTALLIPGSSAFYGQFEGTLHLRAPRVGNDVGIAAIGSTIDGGSSILAEAFRVYQPVGGAMNRALRDSINSDNAAFITAGEAAITSRLLASAPGLTDKLVLAPGVEIINPNGDLTLGLANIAGTTNIEGLSDADWDLSNWRYGLRKAPGVLTLRAVGDLVFNNALSDGFTPISKGTAANYADRGHSLLWLGALQAINDTLPVNTQSWSYRLASGADFGASDFRANLGLKTLDTTQPGRGSVLVGEFFASAVPNSTPSGAGAGVGRDGQTADTIRVNNASNNNDRGTRYEVIRTGTGSIEVAAARDVQLRNPFATIYTAGVGLADRTAVFASGDFSLPVTTPSTHPNQGGTLGAAQQSYAAYYAMAGGDLSLAAGRDIGRFTRLQDGSIVADASMQLPTQWLYRRGAVDSVSGLFGQIATTGFGAFTDHSASTTWWVDYSNFFQGFGALGGGNIRMAAGRDLLNADAAIPTSARMAGQDAASGVSAATRRNLAPDDANLLEHGGGDLVVRAGRNLDGGTFYVERGEAKLTALDEITTNDARSLTPWRLAPSQSLLDSSTWQAVTLFGGRTHFDVAARGDVLLGPTTAAFLLPQGLNNKFWYKTQFQTIDPSAGLTAASTGGAVTHRLGVTLPGDILALPVLEALYRQGSAISPGSAAFYRPWLRSAETATGNFRTMASVGLPSLRSTAFGGDVTVVGQLNLFPSPQGELELLASRSLPGLAVSGLTRASLGGDTIDVAAWTSTRLNLSDADPTRMPTALSPAGNLVISTSTASDTWSSGSVLFLESGSYKGVYGTTAVKSALHAATPVHSANPNPVRLYAAGGDLANMTLFAPKRVRAVASRDITDIAFYLQHTASSDISLVSAGRDLIPFNENAPLRVRGANLAAGNLIVDEALDTVVFGAGGVPVRTKALAGDIQTGGRGIMQVLAGRNIDFGSGANFVDGTGVGLTSIGRLRNPSLPFEGAHYVVMAGVGGASSGPALGLGSSSLEFGTLPYGGFLETGFVGIRDQDVSSKGKLFISSVESERPAGLLGLRRYDRIVSAGGEEIEGLDSLKRVLSGAAPSEDLLLTVLGTTTIELRGLVEDLQGAHLTKLLPTAISGSDANQPMVFVKSVAEGSKAAQMGVLAGDFVESRPAEGLIVIHREEAERSVVLTADHRASGAAMELFQRLKQVGKDAAQMGNYDAGYAAVEAIFGKTPEAGSIFTRARDLRTTSGGSIIAAAPGGGITMASDIFGNPLTPPGIVTEYGGEVSVLTGGNLDIGRARIFTLRGGDLTIWSSRGDIAAGTAAKTVVTAPPTRVLIDAISAEIETDLGGLATGGGIGVLASVAGVEPGAVTLLAPRGTVDAGDAGIRATGNITIAAAQVRNADNIAAGGTSVGVPAAAPVAAPNVGGLSSASSSTAATSQAASDVTRQAQSGAAPGQQEAPSNITVEVLGYGGGEEEEERQEASAGTSSDEQVL